MDRGYGPQPFPRGGFVEHVGHHGGPSNLAWMIFALLLALLLLVLVSMALDAYYRSQASSTGALAVLDQRYARGEIGRDEYAQARGDLGGAPLPAPEAPPPRSRSRSEKS